MPTRIPRRADSIGASDFIALALVEDGRLSWANAAMHRMFGYAPGELAGRPVRAFFVDDASHSAFDAEVAAAIAASGSYRGVFPQAAKDGTVRWCEFHVSPLSDAPGVLVEAIVECAAGDPRTGGAGAGERRFRTVVEDQTEVISRVRSDGTFLYVNDAYCRTFGKSVEELAGRRWQPVVHPEDVAMVEGRLREMAPDNPVVVIENRVLVAGGEMRWMQFVNRGFYDVMGALTEIQSVGRDITPLKQAEAALRESDERLEMALAGSDLVIWDWDIAERRIVSGSRWSGLLGYTAGEVGDGQDAWARLIHPEDLNRVVQAMTAHLRGDTTAFEVEYRMRHKDGHWVAILARGKVTRRDSGNAPLRMVGTLQDISHRKRLNEEGVGLLRRIEALIRAGSARAPGEALHAKAAETLTRRQRQILGMIARGMTSAAIGERLNLATPTVVSHRRNLMAKLNLHNAADVTRFAVEHHIMPGDSDA